MKLYTQNYCLNRASVKKTIINNIVLTFLFLFLFFVFTCGFQRFLRYFLLEHLVIFQILGTELLAGEECLNHSIPHLITYTNRNTKTDFIKYILKV